MTPHELEQQIEGDVDVSPTTLHAYATDASIYQFVPRIIVFPASAKDVAQAIDFAIQHALSITCRGSGTSLAGQAIGTGMLIDFSRYMNRIVSVDNSTAQVEPGVIAGQLLEHLKPYQKHFAPDPATIQVATIGGMISNNACGARSRTQGRTVDHVKSLTLLLNDGSTLVTDPWDNDALARQMQRQDRAGEIIRQTVELINANRNTLRNLFPELPRIATGYALHKLLDPPFDLKHLICGSEGTLACVVDTELHLSPLPKPCTLSVLHYPSVEAALQDVRRILSHDPVTVELMDEVIIDEALRNQSTREDCDFLQEVCSIKGQMPRACLMIELPIDNLASPLDRARKLIAEHQNNDGAAHVFTDQAQQQRVWSIRQKGLGLIARNATGGRKGIAFIEDACLPLHTLAEYHSKVCAIFKRHGLPYSTYAHASVGVLHYRPMLNLSDPADIQRMIQVQRECFDICKQLGGVFSGEHGDGIVRSQLLKDQVSPEAAEIFTQLKHIWDPHQLFNPRRKLNAPAADHNLRQGSSPNQVLTRLEQWETIPQHYHFKDHDHKISNALVACNGMGNCRATQRGNMCPSYRASLQETHSPRGRANLLRLASSQQLDEDGLAGDSLHIALDTCLSCKACTTECPNAVDISRLKAEALQARHTARGTPRHAKWIAHAPDLMARMSGGRGEMFASLINNPVARWYLKRHGFDPRLPLPLPAATRLESLLKNQNLPTPFSEPEGELERANGQGPRGPLVESASGPKELVALFADSWARYLEPHVGLAAVELLESCGFAVHLIDAHNAQRTHISAGLLQQAKSNGTQLAQQLIPLFEEQVPILCIDPSEWSALYDDLPDLIDDQNLASALHNSCHLLEDFLSTRIQAGEIKLQPKPSVAGRRVCPHTHCHHHALGNPESLNILLDAAGFERMPSGQGCCGMAGAFASRNYDLARDVARTGPLPAWQHAHKHQAILVTSGTSCRQMGQHMIANMTIAHVAEITRGTQHPKSSNP